MASISLAAFAKGGFMTDPPAIIEFNSVNNLKSVNMREIWKDINGYEGYYQVSNYGRVKSLKRENSNNQFGHEFILKASSKRRYKQVSLQINGNCKYYSVHRLVAELFVENPFNKEQVNHIDGNKHNNNSTNLEWATPKENTAHAIETGLMPIQKSGIECNRSFQVEMIDKNMNVVKIFGSIMCAQRETGVRSGNISKVINGKAKTAGGYIWNRIFNE